MKKLLLAFACLSFVYNSLSAQNARTMPDMQLKDVNGKVKNLKDYSTSGKITVISFWATWCKPCIKELVNIDELLSDWKQKYNVELVAVSIDNARNVMKVKPFVDSQGWSFDVLLDVNSDLARALNVVNPPQTYVLDKNGNIVYSHTGYVEGDEVALEEKIKAIAGVK